MIESRAAAQRKEGYDGCCPSYRRREKVMPGMGTWTVHSDTDPRWNNSGSAFGDGLIGPQAMQDWIDRCREEYGEPPDDCTKSFWKD